MSPLGKRHSCVIKVFIAAIVRLSGTVRHCTTELPNGQRRTEYLSGDHHRGGGRGGGLFLDIL